MRLAGAPAARPEGVAPRPPPAGLPPPPYPPPRAKSLYTDASEEGLCGFCHGHYFRIELTPEWAVLPMPVL
jgi:hypothetical protein